MIKPNREESLLQKVRESAFVLHELVLFLDTHPYDRKAMAAYQAWQKQYESCKSEYETEVGPLKAFDVRGGSFDWCARPWPWMNRAFDAKGGD